MMKDFDQDAMEDVMDDIEDLQDDMEYMNEAMNRNYQVDVDEAELD